MTTKPIDSLSDIIAAYDHFIIDLWGVMHDGTTLYAGAAEALKSIHNAGKHVLFLSNAPRKASRAIEVLDTLGVTRDHYAHMLTSGQCAHDWLAASNEWGKHYYYLGPSKDEDVLQGLDYMNEPDINNADFILNTGFEYDYQPTDEIQPLLERLIAAKLPLLCVNPDLEVVKQDGTRLLCAGWVAERYQQMGGNVTMVGKPYERVYEEAFARFNTADKSRILAIGDNLLTDIKGANAHGIDSLLISGGILKSEHGQLPDDTLLQELYRQTAATPTYVCSGFRA